MQKASLYSSQILVSYADAIMLNDDKLFTNNYGGWRLLAGQRHHERGLNVASGKFV